MKDYFLEVFFRFFLKKIEKNHKNGQKFGDKCVFFPSKMVEKVSQNSRPWEGSHFFFILKKRLKKWGKQK